METVTLHSDCLLSKWGFGDGDMLNDLLFDWMYPDGWHKTRHVEPHAVLVALVQRYLLPALAAAGHDVEVYEIGTIHNPIRAQKVDSVDNGDHSSWEQSVQWRVQSVDVAVADVLAVANELGRELLRPH